MSKLIDNLKEQGNNELAKTKNSKQPTKEVEGDK